MPEADGVVVAAGVIVWRAGWILLQRRGDDGSWGIPGGRLEPGESLEETARRELFEETGLRATTLRMVDVYSGADFVVRYPDGNAFHVVGATFETDDIIGVSTCDGDETVELSWFGPEAALDIVNPYNRVLIERALAARRARS